MCALSSICAQNDITSENRSEIIRNCYDLNQNYLQIISDRMVVEDEKCSNINEQEQDAARTNMINEIGELINYINEMKENLTFTGSIYQVLEQLTQVVSIYWYFEGTYN